MLRNIPNKIDQVWLITCPIKTLSIPPDRVKTMLKTIVDETSRGKYDFMYLRIGVCLLFQNALYKTNEILRFCKQLQVC